VPKPRILLFTGKGGVGKTTVAAATAVRAAASGLRTLVLSTDPAHSLADSLAVELGDAPTEIAEHLSGQQLDARARLEESWGDIRSYLVSIFDWAGAEGLEAEELSVIPGLDEVFALADIQSHATSGKWDLLVVDCAPTAETIRLLSLPDVLDRYMQRVFPAQRALTRAARPVLRRLTDMPIASDTVFAATHRFYDRLEGVRELLTDGERTSARIVVNPERMVVAEARRTFTYLSLFGYHVDAVIANRLLPDAVSDPWFEEWKRVHKEQLAVIEESFAPVPVLPAPLLADEPVGVERLAELGALVYGDAVGAERLHADQTLRIHQRGESVFMDLALPCVERDDVDLARVNGELLVTVGPYRRSVALPDSLHHRSVAGARLIDGRLEVEFAAGASPSGARRS